MHKGLLPALARLSSRVLLASFAHLTVCKQSWRCLYAMHAMVAAFDACMVWAVPRSLAATWGIEVSFFSSGYLDVSVHPVFLHQAMCSPDDTAVLSAVGCPIRRSTGQCLLTAGRGFSQLVASFVGFWCLGIHLMLLVA